MSEIPTEELHKWYNKVLENPFFLDTLTIYQKIEFKTFIEKEINKNYFTAIELSGLCKEENFPKGLPEDKRINHILFVNMNTKRPIYVLNLFGWNWTPEKSYFRIETEMSLLQQEIKEVVFDPKVVEPLIDFFENYISKKEHSNLKLLFRGKSILGRLTFLHRQNQLADIFYRLHKKGYITSSREKTKDWLIKYFMFLDENNSPKPCNKSSLTDSFTPSKTNKRPSQDEAISNKIDLFKA